MNKFKILFKNGSYIYTIPIEGDPKRPLKMVYENQPIDFESKEYYNAILNVLEKINAE